MARISSVFFGILFFGFLTQSFEDERLVTTNSISSDFFLSHLSLIREATNASQLEKDLKEVQEEQEIKRGCQIEKEIQKIPKTCFIYSHKKSLSRKKRLEIKKEAEDLCQKLAQNSSLLLLEKWKQIPSLSPRCQSFLQKQEILLRYRQGISRNFRE